MSIREPLKWFIDEKDFRFYLIDCGAGLMHLIIFPDNTVMLFDCNVTNDKEEEIINYLGNVIPFKYDYDIDEERQIIDVFVNSHRDEDHYRGLKKIHKQFEIKSIWDSGQSGENTDSSDYQYYMRLRRTLKEDSEDNLFVPTPSNEMIESFGGVDIYCLAAERDFEYVESASLIEHEAKKQHTNSMVLLMVYQGRKMLLTGDSDWKSWKEQIVSNFDGIKPNYEDTDILVASHHGSRSFFTEEDCIDEEEYPDTTYIESIELINPVITLISCADYNYKDYHLPNKEAMELYKEYTSHKDLQIHTTYEKGTLCGYIDGYGNYGVVPNRFYNKTPRSDRSFRIVAEKSVGDGWKTIESGDKVRIETNLRFKVIGVGDLINTHDRIRVIWEVCNNGTLYDYEHKEVYYKRKNEDDNKFSFSRKVAYHGLHLLRCKVINKTKGFTGTRVFVVEGV